jgi:hypothetical protein
LNDSPIAGTTIDGSKIECCFAAIDNFQVR